MFPLEPSTLSLVVKFMILIAVTLCVRLALSYRYFAGRSSLVLVPIAICLALLMAVERIQASGLDIAAVMGKGSWAASSLLSVSLLFLFLCLSTLIFFWCETVRIANKNKTRVLPVIQRVFWQTIREWFRLFGLSLGLSLVLYWGGLVVISSPQLINTVWLIFLGLITYTSLRKLFSNSNPYEELA